MKTISRKRELVERMHEATRNLLERGAFQNGWVFRPTQREALEAYEKYLSSSRSLHDRLRGYFEMPTGIGKTAFFLGLVDLMHKKAQEEGEDFKTVIVVPTTNLMGQTRREFVNCAPDLLPDIGLYGNKRTEFGRPVTIITYDSWIKLVENGDLNSANVDLHISDEAHRGTNERRVNDINFFDDRTMCIATTATASFDEYKTVQRSHQNRIFYKSTADAIRGGELAPYIQSQLHVMRALPPEPSLVEEFMQVAGPDAEGEYRWMQIAWNHHVLAIFRDGYDVRNGEPLSDNQAAFYTRGTAQADHLAFLLNRDVTLHEKAQAMGYENVAVSIHSYMPDTVQEDLLQAYQDGKYLVVVGASKFKEGFDHKPLKTIIDCPHGSLVDKTQIIGRGARQWENTNKDNRLEGLTFVDTIIYEGSEDLEIDKQNRKIALSKARLAKDILGDVCVLGPHAPEVNTTSRGRQARPIFGPNVTSYVELEDIQTIIAERSHLLREHYVEITDEMREQLIEHRERTLISPQKLLDHIAPEEMPENLTHQIVGKWFPPINGEGRPAKTADIKHLEIVLKTYASLPTATARPVPIEERYIENLKAQIERTGFGFTRFLSRFPDCPEGLNINKMITWLDGRAKTALPEHLDWVEMRFEELPDNTKLEMGETERKALTDEKERTGVAEYALVKDPSTPEGLTGPIIASWLNGSVVRTERDSYDWVLNKWQELPDKKQRIEFTQEMYDELVEQKKRTGVGQNKLLSQAKDCPTDLTAGTVASWFHKKNGKLKETLRKDWYEWVINRWRSLPDAPAKRIPFTDDSYAELMAYKEATGVPPLTLIFNSTNPNKPPRSVVSGLCDPKRRIKTVREDYWNWLKTEFQKLPATENKRITITENMRVELLSQTERVGLGTTRLFAKLDGKPDGLSVPMVDAWKAGKAKSADEKHWNWLIQGCRSLPNKNASHNNDSPEL
ncbi:MAG: DEAD/DEAH box helicase [Alphaproteobacteria bacterium]|nr:DEAD/DEAH box helicase [Alphaproteobacteria bacterium]